MKEGIPVILSSYPLVASLFAILVAQFVKIPIAYFSKSNRASLKLAVSTGGMPSSHSAAVSSLITALVLQYGMASPYVAIALSFGVIVMFDAMAVRRQCGEQGIVIERLVKELQKRNALDSITFKDPDDDEDLHLEDMVVNKYLGHKPNEVFAGVLTGLFSTLLLDFLFNFL